MILQWVVGVMETVFFALCPGPLPSPLPPPSLPPTSLTVKASPAGWMAERGWEEESHPCFFPPFLSPLVPSFSCALVIIVVSARFPLFFLCGCSF